jgi:hypothetical protein
MDNVGIVVESLDDAIAFFAELGLALDTPFVKSQRARPPRRLTPTPEVSSSSTYGTSPRPHDVSFRLRGT